MVDKFALGKRFEITDRKAFKNFAEAYGPNVVFESWAGNSVPKAIVILEDREAEGKDIPYYKIRNEHLNGNQTTIKMFHDIIQEMVEKGVLVESEE